MEKVSPGEPHRFQSRGMFAFKNLSEEKEVFEVIAPKDGFLQVDPVCRMLILSEDKAIRHPEIPTLFFCSESCLRAYNTANQSEIAAN